MPSLRTLFWPKGRSKSAQPRSRVPWTRLRHAHSATAPLNQQPAPTAPTEEVQAPETESREGDGNVSHEETVNNNDTSQVEHPVAEEPEPDRNSNDADSASRFQHGSKRFRNIMARFRTSKSADHSSVSEPIHLPEPQDTQGPATTTTDPVKKDIPSRNPSAVDRADQEQKRNVSSQTAASQDSNHTTVRRPSQRISLSLDESQSWLDEFVNFDNSIAHMLEPSDPFSDGKNAELRREAVASSKHSEDQGLGQIEQSSKKSQPGSILIPTQSRGNSLAQRGSRTSSGSSHASRGSRISRLDSSKASVAFNVLASKWALQLSIATEDPPTGHAGDRRTSEESMPRRRHRFINRVRPVQSSTALSETSQPPISKLRRTKTFANLTRRPDPFRALRGRTLETLSRLGGHSYLVLPGDLAPAPLQLPACMVAMLMYLRKFGANVPELFSEPPDLKVSIRMYDSFANQVLSAEKYEPKIAMTMRVIAMPDLKKDPGIVLSVGWVLKALLAGLPEGILGSDRLYQALTGIYTGTIPAPVRVRLIALALVALTSEMQCALICGVFGLLTGLLPEDQSNATNATSPPESPGGNPDRSVAAQLNADGVARIFGPLLLGASPGDSAAPDHVEREIEEQRVMGLVLGNWRGISRQLRGWAS